MSHSIALELYYAVFTQIVIENTHLTIDANRLIIKIIADKVFAMKVNELENSYITNS